MSAALSVRFTRAEPAPALLRAQLGRPLMAALGKRLEIALRSHFEKRNAAPNKHRSPRSNFWNRPIRDNTALQEATATTATVAIADPAMAQKIHGGPIVPKERQYLSVPARGEAYGRSPRLFDDLKFIPLRRGDLAGMLVREGDLPALRKGAKVAYYFLLGKVDQQPDPDALPKPADLSQALKHEGDEYIARITALAGGTQAVAAASEFLE